MSPFSFIPNLDDWVRIAPEIVVAGSGLLLLIADLLTPARRKGWLALFALLALAGGLAAAITLYFVGDNQPSFLGMVTDDWLALWAIWWSSARACWRCCSRPATSSARASPSTANTTRCCSSAVSGHDADGVGHQLYDHLPGTGNPVAGALHPLGLHLRALQVAGSGHEILPAQFVCLRLPALWHGADLWLNRHDQPERHQHVSSHHAPNLASSAFGSDYGPMLVIGMGLLAVGFLFKVSAIPFHAWTPDVYEGAPTSITAFMSVGTKTAAFVALARVFMVALHRQGASWSDIIWAVAILTMIGGNILAATQSNVKRMLAYSSIAHAGYILVGRHRHRPAFAAMLVYLAAMLL